MKVRANERLEVREAGAAPTCVELGHEPLAIGRGLENQIVLADGYASARHAELVRQRGAWCVRDLGSTNGTRVNGAPLPPGRLQALHDGDLVEIGDTVLIYHAAPPRQAAGPGDERPVRRRAWGSLGRGLVRLLLAVLALAGLAAAAGWLLAPPRVTMLVLGTDARPDELRRGVAGRTDTLLTVVADRAAGRLLLISIPRDLWVEIPGYGAERINTAYALGGPTLAERVAGNVLGVPVERHLVIGLQGVRDVVDAAGGVEIDVARPIHDDAYPTDEYGTIVMDIPAGRQWMDGETALRYARTRHQDSDFGRMARQQQVLVALRNRLLSPAAWWRAPAVIAALRRATATDLGPLDLVALAFAVGAGGAEPERLALDVGLVEEVVGNGGAYLLRPTPALRQRVGVLLAPGTAAVEVLNGAETAGLAARAAARLGEQGARVVHVGNAPRPQPTTTVEVAPGLARAGQHAASLLGLGLPREAVRESPSLPPGVDVRITLGRSFALP